jgi:hypothetical protein
VSNGSLLILGQPTIVPAIRLATRSLLDASRCAVRAVPAYLLGSPTMSERSRWPSCFRR